MFGVSFFELVVLVLLGIVVIGPRDVPRLLRALGRTVAKVRRMANTFREQSGIDEILKAEGIEREVQELRKLATGRILDIDLDVEEPPPSRFGAPSRHREFPIQGPDAYGALPDDADPYLPERQDAALDEVITRSGGRPRIIDPEEVAIISNGVTSPPPPHG